MHTSFGPLQVTLKNTYQRKAGGSIVYQRAVPSDLQSRYAGKTIKHDLKTSDVTVAARQVEAFNRRYEAAWRGMRASPDSSPEAFKVHVEATMRDHGLEPGDTSSVAAAVFLDGLEEKLQRHARGDTDTYEDAVPADYLTPVEAAVLKSVQVRGKPVVHAPTLSEALTLHLSIHSQRDDPKFVQYQRRAFDTLLDVVGDKAVDRFTRADARAYLEASLRTTKTTTVKRRLGAIAAVFAAYIRENDLHRPNPFAKLEVPKLGHDSKKRVPFTTGELAALQAACKAADDPMRWTLAILSGTGARLAEVVGMLLSDIVLEGDVPHVILQVHPWRGIKGAKGIRGVKDRIVPLAGVALWAAKQVKAAAPAGQVFAFPQYTDNKECKSSGASSALAGWMRRLSLPHTSHELRHTVVGQLRAVQCPKDIMHSITGHGVETMSDRYGDGHGLKTKREWLVKAFAAEPDEVQEETD